MKRGDGGRQLDRFLLKVFVSAATGCARKEAVCGKTQCAPRSGPNICLWDATMFVNAIADKGE